MTRCNYLTGVAMSRSYKKTPGWKDSNPGMKAYANRSFRRKTKDPEFEIQDGCQYRHHTCSYNICDWKSLYYNRVQVLDAIKFAEDLWGDDPAWSQYITPLHRYYMK